MTAHDFFPMVKECLCRALNLDENTAELVTLETNAADLEGWDSLTHLELILELENQFDIQIEDEDVVDLVSVKAILEALESKKA